MDVDAKNATNISSSPCVRVDVRFPISNSSLCAYSSPDSAVNILFAIRNAKDVGAQLLAYPTCRALALPCVRISNSR